METITNKTDNIYKMKLKYYNTKLTNLTQNNNKGGNNIEMRKTQK